jgi:hypothetical protein
MYIFYILRKVVGIDGVLSSKRLVFTGIVAPIAAFSAVIVFGGFGKHEFVLLVNILITYFCIIRYLVLYLYISCQTSFAGSLAICSGKK